MASRGQYLLKIGGRLRGNTEPRVLADLRARAASIFADPDTRGTAAFDNRPGDGWTRGFILVDFAVCQWTLSIDGPYEPNDPQDIRQRDEDRRNGRAWPDEIMLTFQAEVHHTRDGSLFLNRRRMIPEVKWFYNYRRYRWHAELSQALNELNHTFQASLIERVWFRDWKWYCGNGGC